MELLQEYNPKISPSQWNYSSYQKDCPFENKLKYEPEKYTYRASLIFHDCDSRWDPVVIYEEGKPSHILVYEIYFTVCRDRLQYLEFSYDDLVYQDVDPYDFLVKFHPRDLSFTECSGNKCRRSFSPGDNGVWCKSCFDINSPGFLNELFRNDICFRDIPREALLHFSCRKEPIDWQNTKLVDTINEKIQREILLISEIKKRIDSYKEDIEAYTRKINEKREKDIEELNKLLEKYGEKEKLA